MKRGRKPAPTAIKIAKGTRADRISKGEPKAPAGIPDRPAFLKGVAAQEWDFMAPLLADSGILTKLDGRALALYCFAFARFLRSQEAFDANELGTTSQRGGTRSTPYGKMCREESLLSQRLLAEFGLTPSARTRLSIETPAEDDPLAAFLKRKPS